MQLIVLTFPLDGGDPDGWRGLDGRCAAICAGLPGLLAQAWALNARAGAVGGLLTWADEAARERGEVVALARLVALPPLGTAPRLRAYAVARAPARTICAPLPCRETGGWDQYEI